jgi:GH43 family beta-xylosidase
MRTKRLISTLIVMAVIIISVLSLSIPAAAATFSQPIVDTNNTGGGAADPWVTYKDGYYYYCRSLGDAGIGVAKAKRLQDIGAAPMTTVYTPPSGQMYSKEIWAPELHYLDGQWYIYFAADDGNNNNHRMYVLQGNSQDPQGSYFFIGKIAATTDRWAIDGTVLVKDDGTKYFVWSGWAGTTNVQQNLYIAPMSNAYTISGERVLISQPTNTWEKNGGSPYINEGPEILKKNGVIHIIYSASGSWCDDYCLGRLTCTNGNVLNAGSWSKTGPVFTKATGAYGPGHASFTKSPNGTQDWLVYHADQNSGGSWANRSVRAQSFSWSGNNPSFGTPNAYGALVTEPAGTVAVIRYESESATMYNCRVVNESNASGGKVTGYIDYSDSYVQFTVNASTAGTYLLVARTCNGCTAASSHNVYVNGASVGSITYLNKGWNVFTYAGTYVNLNAGNNTIKFMKGANYAELDYIEVVAK